LWTQCIASHRISLNTYYSPVCCFVIFCLVNIDCSRSCVCIADHRSNSFCFFFQTPSSEVTTRNQTLPRVLKWARLGNGRPTSQVLPQNCLLWSDFFATTSWLSANIVGTTLNLHVDLQYRSLLWRNRNAA